VKRLLSLALICMIAASTWAPAYAEPSPEAADYLDRAISLIREHHKDSRAADWDQIRRQALDDIAAANTTSETYPAIWRVLRTLGETHSFLVEPDSAGQDLSAASEHFEGEPNAPMPTWEIVQNRYAVVRLPDLNTMAADGEASGKAYTAALRQGLERMDRDDLCGWVVDLRGNGGGNMWPMLQGLDPLLGSPPFGYFTLRGSKVSMWSRTNGSVLAVREDVSPSAPSYVLKRGQSPLAVLLGPETSSSGEMTAIALIGRDKVRTFGAPTAGFTTGNSVYSLSDGAFLVITTVAVRDRKGKDHIGPIVPDVATTNDEAESTAIDWLSKACM